MPGVSGAVERKLGSLSRSAAGGPPAKEYNEAGGPPAKEYNEYPPPSAGGDPRRCNPPRPHSETAVLDPSDPWLYELCFQRAITGEAEVSCPACPALLTVAVDDPIGSQNYQCSECGAVSKVNWGA